MSRNFELLYNHGQDQLLFAPVARPRLPLCLRRHSPSGPTTAADSEILTLIDRLFLNGTRTSRVRAVTFVSLAPGNGNAICGRTAELLASRVTAPVCVVDAKFDAPSLHQYFGVNDEETNEGHAIQIGDANLTLLATGTAMGRSAQLTTAVRLLELRDQLDYLLVDAPATPSLTEATALGRMTDGIILVVEANVTRREAALRAKLHFEQAHVPILGAVLNNLPSATSGTRRSE
jgi:Mrp family chromosome partitioning ATPase